MTYTNAIQSLAIKRPEADSYMDVTDALERGTCRIRVRPPDDSSKIKEVKISLTFEESSDDVKDELQDAATSNRTVDLRLSLEDVDNTLELPETKIEPESRPPSGDRPFRAVGGSKAREAIAPHFNRPSK